MGYVRGACVLAVFWAAVGIGPGAYAGTNYSIPEEDIAALLDEEYYTGGAGQFGASTDPVGRWAYFASLSNDGTKVAFLGLTLQEFAQRVYVVDVGDPASWRDTGRLAPLRPVIWSNDDEYVAVGDNRYHLDSNSVDINFYTLSDPAGLDLMNDACTSLQTSFEFNTDSDAEGWGPGPDVSNVSVSGGTLTGTVAQIDEFGPNITRSGLSIDASTASFVIIRMRVTTDAYHDAAVFWGHDGSPLDGTKFIRFALGPQGEWHTYVVHVAANSAWDIGLPVDVLRIDPNWPTPFATTGTFEIDFIRVCEASALAAYADLPISDDGSVIYPIDVSSTTAKSSDNIAVGTWDDVPLARNMVVFGINDDLSSNDGIQPLTIVSEFPSGTEVHIDPRLSNDGTLLAFSRRILSTQSVFGDPGFENDISDIYVFDGLQDVLNGLQPTITSLGDSRIHEIRTLSEGGQRYKALPIFSPDKSLVVYAEDFNDRFIFDGIPGIEIATSFTEADFEIMLSTPLGNDGPPVDGANTSDDRRFTVAGNQYISDGSKNGLRLIMSSQSSLVEPQRIFIATFVQSTTLDSTNPVTEGETTATIGGETTALPFTTTDSAVQVTAETEVNDASGTTVVLAQDQVINFPAGSGTTAISISTPTEPVSQPQLPPDPGITAIAVQRTFGPEGTQFYPPIPITIAYLDAEIGDGDEATIQPYLFNESTGIFDIPVPEEDIVERDLANNTITFLVDHFSTYGLGVSAGASLPAADPLGLVAAAVALALAGCLFVQIARLRRAR